MGKKVAVAIIHGIGQQTQTYAAKMLGKLEPLCKDCFADLVFEPVCWANPFEETEEILWDQTTKDSRLSFQKIRRMVIFLAADAIAYQTTSPKWWAYDEVHGEFAKAMQVLAAKAGEDAPLCIISHSLGTVITSNYIYDLQAEQRDREKSGTADPKPSNLPASVLKYKQDTPLERGETLTLLYTLGSPLALWKLRYKSFDSPITVPAPSLKDRYPELEEIGRWVNFYDKDDIVAYPLRGLNKEYAAAVNDDKEVNVGGALTNWNPASHMKYWTDRDVLRPIAESLRKVWEAINAK